MITGLDLVEWQLEVSQGYFSIIATLFLNHVIRSLLGTLCHLNSHQYQWLDMPLKRVYMQRIPVIIFCQTPGHYCTCLHQHQHIRLHQNTPLPKSPQSMGPIRCRQNRQMLSVKLHLLCVSRKDLPAEL